MYSNRYFRFDTGDKKRASLKALFYEKQKSRKTGFSSTIRKISCARDKLSKV